MLTSNIIEQVAEILDLLYRHSWDERNGGNLSLIVDEAQAKTITDIRRSPISTISYNFDLTPLIGHYLIVTGTGKYFKNALKDPETNLGLLRVKDSSTIEILWGYADGGKPTSELPTHLMSHMERLKVDPEHRLIIHCHPTNTICLSHILPFGSDKMTEILWKMQTESIVVFPEGVAVLPWMVCGGNEIGEATAALMKEYRSVIWTKHGLFCAGRGLDEVFGLIETIEKAAEIYMKVCDKQFFEPISNEQLIALTKAFNIDFRHGIID